MVKETREPNDVEREAINKTLLEILPIGIDSGSNLPKEYTAGRWVSLIKYLSDEFQINTDLYRLLEHAHNLADLFVLGAWAREGVIKGETFRTLREIILDWWRLPLVLKMVMNELLID